MRTRTFLALLCGAAAAAPLPPTPAAAQRDCAPAAGCPRGAQPPSTDEPAPSPARAPAAEPAAASTYAAPVIDTSPQSLDYGLVNAAASHAGYTTPAYVSRDVPRSVTLFYSSASTASRGFVQVDATDNSTQAPTQMSIRVKAPDGSWWTPETFYQGAVGTSRLGVSWDMSAATTGTYDGTVVVRSYFADGSVTESSSPVRVPVVTRDMAAWSGLAPGWAIAGQQRVRTAATLALWLTNGDGTIERFDQDAGGLYHGLASDPTTLRYDGAGSIIRAYPDGGNVYFSATSGEMTKQVDRFGNTTTWNHDAAWRLTSIVDPAGKAITFGYLSGGTGQLSTITDPGGRITRLYYNAATDLTSIVDPAGGIAFQADYQDAFHRMTNTWDRAGQMTTYAYGGNSLLCCVWAPTITVGGQSVRPYTVAFSPVDAALPAAGKGTQSVPADHKTGASVEGYVTDPNGNTTYAAVTAAGSPWRIRDPLGRTTSIAWNAAGQPLRTLAPNGHAVSYTWSGLDLVKVWDEATGDSTRYTYGPYHQPTLVLTGSDTAAINTYDTQGTLETSRAPRDTLVTRYQFTTDGRIWTITDPERHETVYEYPTATYGNAWGNTQSVQTGTYASNTWRATQFGYDGYGRQNKVKDPANDSTLTTYDLINRPVDTTDPAGLVTHMGYGVLSDTVRDAKGQVYTYGHNALGWLTDEGDPRGKHLLYAYDRNGNAVSATNRRGSTVTATYDALNRIATRTADGQTTTWSYDSSELWMEVANGVTTEHLAYDLAGRMVQASTARPRALYTLTSTLRANGVRTQVAATGPWTGAKSIRYHYDLRGQLDTLTDLAGGTTVQTYNSDGMPTGTLLPNGVLVAKGFPSTHLTAQIAYSSGGNYTTANAVALNTAFGFGYSHDPRSLIGFRQNTSGDTVRTYSYDKLGRLTHWMDEEVQGGTTTSCSGSRNFSFDPDNGVCGLNGLRTAISEDYFVYDSVGNRRDLGGVVDTGNRQLYLSPYTMVYDDDGNLIHKYAAGFGFDQTLSWNSLGQLTQVVTNGVTVTYQYDPFGRWTHRVSGTSDIQYVWDGDNLMFERDKAGNLTEYTYYPGIDDPHSIKRGSTVNYYATDFVGSVVGLMDSAQHVTDQYRYDSWGNSEYKQETVANPLQFQARHLDPVTGLYAWRARWYDPAVGRFISEDPTGLSGGINPYMFAANNAINFVDPSGMKPTPKQVAKCTAEFLRDHRAASEEFAKKACSGFSLGPIYTNTPRNPGATPAPISGRGPNYGNTGGSGHTSPSGTAGSPSANPITQKDLCIARGKEFYKSWTLWGAGITTSGGAAMLGSQWGSSTWTEISTVRVVQESWGELGQVGVQSPGLLFTPVFETTVATQAGAVLTSFGVGFTIGALGAPYLICSADSDSF